MTDNQYLESVIKTQCLSAEELKELEQHRLEIESLLREKIGSKPIIKYAGSKAKGTMIKENYDLDMVCYFLSDEGRTLKELYEYVKGILSAKYIVEPKASALRIKAKAMEVKLIIILTSFRASLLMKLKRRFYTCPRRRKKDSKLI